MDDHRVLAKHVGRDEEVQLPARPRVRPRGGPHEPGDAAIGGAIGLAQPRHETRRVGELVLAQDAHGKVLAAERAVVGVVVSDRRDPGEKVADPAEEEAILEGQAHGLGRGVAIQGALSRSHS